jgi:peptidoglycan/LPS O-acetylase OafA/YrhL
MTSNPPQDAGLTQQDLYGILADMNGQLTRISGADGLRALACLLVVWHHTTQRFNPENSAAWIQGIHFFGMRGEVGVSLFFVLSGCLLSLPFWNSFVNADRVPNLRFYAINRAARIIPAYWFNLLFCTLIAFWIFDQNINWWRLISGLFFINSYHYSSFFPAELNGPLWSIGLEVSCYVLLPVILFLIIKNTKKISVAFAGIIGVIFALQIFNPWILNNFMTSNKSKGWQYGLTGGAKQWLPYWNIDSFFTQFLCGSLAALIIVALRARGIMNSRTFDFSAILFTVAAISLVAIRLEPGAPDSFTKQPYMAPFYSILMAGVIVSASFSTQIYKMLDNRLFRWIAKISFSIYLWHMFLIVIIERKFFSKYIYYGLTDLSHWVFISSIVLMSSIAIAATSWRFLESPILKSARKLTSNKV